MQNVNATDKPAIKHLKYYYVAKGEIRIDHESLIKFLSINGFAKIYPPGCQNSLFIHVVNNMVSEVSPEQIKDFVLSHARTQSGPLPDEPGMMWFNLISKLVSGASSFFSKEKLECLPVLDAKFQVDTIRESNFYFKNCIVKVSPEQILIDDYSGLDSLVIWKKEVIGRNFKQKKERSVFEDFCWKITAQNQQRFNSLCSSIGYLLHRFKDPACALSVILLDEKISDAPDGRSGKTVLCVSLGHMRPAVFVDGKVLDTENRFCFSNVKLGTKIVILDDVKRNFPIETLFHAITSGFEVETKGKPRIEIPFEEAPKLCVTSNYMIQSEGGSAQARMLEVALFPHFSKEHTPREEFGHTFFTDWDQDEWSRFDSFMIDCVAVYLKSGLIRYVNPLLSRRKLIQSTNIDFVNFLDSRYRIQSDGSELGQFNPDMMGFAHAVSKEDLYLDMLAACPDIKKSIERGRLTVNRITSWYGIYANNSGLKLTMKKIRKNGEPTMHLWFDPNENQEKSGNFSEKC